MSYDARLIFVATPYSSAIQSVFNGVFDILVAAGLKEGVDYDYDVEFYAGSIGAERRMSVYITEEALNKLGDYYAKFMPVIQRHGAPLFVESGPNLYTPDPYSAALPANDAVLSYLSNSYAEPLVDDPASDDTIINPAMVAAFFNTAKEGRNKLFKDTTQSFDLTDKDNVDKIKADLGIRNTFIKLADVRYVPDKGVEVDISVPGRPVMTHVYNNIDKSVVAGWRTRKHE